MWFADVVLDLEWYAEARGKLGTPKARATQAVEAPSLETEFLLYGDETRIRHLRVMMETEDHSVAEACVNANIHRWINCVEVASSLATAHHTTVAMLVPEAAQFAVLLGQGDEQADAVQLDPKYAPATEPNFEGAAALMAAWLPDFRIHLHYLARFLNRNLPPEMRWLNGYRVLEWHFMRGKVGLGRSPAFKDFVRQVADRLDAVRASGQTREGLVEEVRALVAHAQLAKREAPKLEGVTADLVLRTFPAMEQMVMAVMNQGVDGRLRFYPLRS